MSDIRDFRIWTGFAWKYSDNQGTGLHSEYRREFRKIKIRRTLKFTKRLQSVLFPNVFVRVSVYFRHPFFSMNHGLVLFQPSGVPICSQFSGTDVFVKTCCNFVLCLSCGSSCACAAYSCLSCSSCSSCFGRRGQKICESHIMNIKHHHVVHKNLPGRWVFIHRVCLERDVTSHVNEIMSVSFGVFRFQFRLSNIVESDLSLSNRVYHWLYFRNVYNSIFQEPVQNRIPHAS